MKLLWHLFNSSVGKKYLMALTGLFLFLFVIGHMLGNLQIFLGRGTLNAYAAFLKSEPILLWGARLALLVALVIHVYCAVKLSLDNRAARTTGYELTLSYKASYASRTMAWSGFIVFCFVVYHLLHFTFGVVMPGSLDLKDALGRHDVYQMVINGFSKKVVSLFYLFSMALLCIHLSHGVGSLFHSIGLKNEHWGPRIDAFAIVSASLIFIGNCSIPIAVLLGLLHE